MSISDYRWLRDETKADFENLTYSSAVKLTSSNTIIGNIRRLDQNGAALWYEKANQQAALLVEHQELLGPDEILSDADSILNPVDQIKRSFKETDFNTTASPGREYQSAGPKLYAEISDNYRRFNERSRQELETLKPLHDQAVRFEETVRPVLEVMQTRALLDPECTTPIARKIERLVDLSEQASLADKHDILRLVLNSDYRLDSEPSPGKYKEHQAHGFRQIAGKLLKANVLTTDDRRDYIAHQLDQAPADPWFLKWHVEALLPFAPDEAAEFALKKQKVDLTVALAEREPGSDGKTYELESRERLLGAMQADAAASPVPSDERNMFRQAQFRLEYPLMHSLLELLDVTLDLSGPGVKIGSILKEHRPTQPPRNAPIV